MNLPENLPENLLKNLLKSNQQVWNNLERVAWIRTGAIGDLLVGLAALAETPTLFPNARITVVGPKQWMEILQPSCFPFIDRIAVVERRKTRVRVAVPEGRGWRFESESETPLATLLKDYDGCVNLNIDSLRYAVEAMRARVGVRIGAISSSLAWLYTHNAPHFGKDPLLHERDVPLLLLELATPGLPRFVRTARGNRSKLSDWVQASQLIAKWRPIGLPPARIHDSQRAETLTARKPRTYVLVNPTASRREKTWPAERMRSLLTRLKPDLQKENLEALVIGAPNETEWLKEVAGHDHRVIQPPTLSDLQDIVAHARALITNVSSMQFVAASTHTPTLTIFGRANATIWGPVGPADRTVRAKLEKGERIEDFSGFEGELRMYDKLDVSEVVRECKILIGDREGGLR